MARTKIKIKDPRLRKKPKKTIKLNTNQFANKICPDNKPQLSKIG